MKTKFTKWYSRQSITIRAAIIGGCFAILASIITGVLELAKPDAVIIMQPPEMTTQITNASSTSPLPTKVTVPSTATLSPLILSVELVEHLSNISYVVPQAGSLYDDEVRAQVEQAIANGEYRNWSFIPPDSIGSYIIRITNITTDNTWVRINPVLEADITVSPVPEGSPNVIYEFAGGGAGEIWLLEDIDLVSYAESYTQSTKILQYWSMETWGDTPPPPPDYIALQPGEFFEFLYPFNCIDPGIYQTNLTIFYSANRQDNSITITDFPIAKCLPNFTYWSIWFNRQESHLSIESMRDVKNYDYKTNGSP